MPDVFEGRSELHMFCFSSNAWHSQSLLALNVYGPAKGLKVDILYKMSHIRKLHCLKQQILTNTCWDNMDNAS